MALGAIDRLSTNDADLRVIIKDFTIQSITGCLDVIIQIPMLLVELENQPIW